jgi:hypothetical protein
LVWWDFDKVTKCLFCIFLHLTLSLMALLPPPYPTALGQIGPSKKDICGKTQIFLMTSGGSDQTFRPRAAS